MDPGVTWLPFLWKTPIAATSDEIAAAERELGVKLPTDVVDVLLASQGALPEPHHFDYTPAETGKKRTGSAGAIFHVRGGERDALARYNIVARTNEIRSVGGRKTLVPLFEETTKGNYVCLDYGEDAERPAEVPSVAVLDFETMGTTRIAASFMDFLVSLYDDGPLNRSHVTDDGDEVDEGDLGGSAEDYACNECLGLIEGVRWHCEECFEYDVCDKCHARSVAPAGSSNALVLHEGDEHKREHKMTRHGPPGK